MTLDMAHNLIMQELEQAVAKHPRWPVDPIHAVAIMAEESGEAVRASLNMVYESGNMAELRREVIQTGAMAFRVLMNLDYSEWGDK